MTPERQALLNIAPQNWTASYRVGVTGAFFDHLCGAGVRVDRDETLHHLIERVAGHVCPDGFEPSETEFEIALRTLEGKR